MDEFLNILNKYNDELGEILAFPYSQEDFTQDIDHLLNKMALDYLSIYKSEDFEEVYNFFWSKIKEYIDETFRIYN
ncbi:hypothetical protein ABC255_08640 [Neobacillus sp. 3P2-tot-E-2]|uniref:hypothetical protein n=1 Tax=Neobacillus sp. 3P2-tot-E-2 TaxID=3132212 RepID=UPI0039A17E56